MAVVNCALFVDFDNIFSGLKEHDERVAREFATNPMGWVRWLEREQVNPEFGEGAQRRMLIRRCYLNPQVFYEYRPFFIKAAFTVVDTPKLTRMGKTSSDIHLVIDALDALNHTTRFDEFIILSADADFTPLLIRLREHDRRTVVMAAGLMSPAYLAASGHVISENDFIERALGEASHGEEREPETLDDEVETLATAAVHEEVSEAPRPVPMAKLAGKVRKRLQAQGRQTSDWFGQGGFSDFLRHLDLGRLQVSDVIPGYVYDPSRHNEPRESNTVSEFREEHPEIFPLALEVHKLTNVPLLPPESYKAVFEEIVDEINENGFSLSDTPRNVFERCMDRDLQVARFHVNFILNGLRYSGYRFAAPETPNDLAHAFIKNIKYLLDMAEADFDIEKDKDRLDKLFRWIFPK